MAEVLETLLGSRTRAAVLGHLFPNAGQQYFVRELAEAIGEDSTNVSRELRQLAGLDLVVRTSSGRQVYYRANESHPLFPELRGLAVKTVGLSGALRDLLRDLGERVEVAFVYGSWASGTAAGHSDIDLFVVGSVTLSEITEVLHSAQALLGREINPTLRTGAEFRRDATKSAFVRTVLAQPKLFLIGSEDELVRLGA